MTEEMKKEIAEAAEVMEDCIAHGVLIAEAIETTSGEKLQGGQIPNAAGRLGMSIFSVVMKPSMGGSIKAFTDAMEAFKKDLDVKLPPSPLMQFAPLYGTEVPKINNAIVFGKQQADPAGEVGEEEKKEEKKAEPFHPDNPIDLARMELTHLDHFYLRKYQVLGINVAHDVLGSSVTPMMEMAGYRYTGTFFTGEGGTFTFTAVIDMGGHILDPLSLEEKLVAAEIPHQRKYPNGKVDDQELAADEEKAKELDRLTAERQAAIHEMPPDPPKSKKSNAVSVPIDPPQPVKPPLHATIIAGKEDVLGITGKNITGGKIDLCLDLGANNQLQLGCTIEQAKSFLEEAISIRAAILKFEQQNQIKAELEILADQDQAE